MFFWIERNFLNLAIKSTDSLFLFIGRKVGNLEEYLFGGIRQEYFLAKQIYNMIFDNSVWNWMLKSRIWKDVNGELRNVIDLFGQDYFLKSQADLWVHSSLSIFIMIIKAI